MSSVPSRPLKRLIVEGTDDLFVIAEATSVLRPAWGTDARSWFGGFLIHDAKSDDRALKEFALALKGPAEQHVGLVLDADDQRGKKLQDRWKAACAQVEPLLIGVTLPGTAAPGGWVQQIPKGPKVGVWLMPDNQQTSGALEAFLAPMVPTGDPCWAHAEQVLDEAKRLGAPFPEHHRTKARLHTWLAWRKEAGRPYGRSIKVGDLDPRNNPAAEALAQWLEALFALARSSSIAAALQEVTPAMRPR